jgi:putative ABC transport system permease protein
MISLAGRDIAHAWGKFLFYRLGLGLLLGVTLVMAGVYRAWSTMAKRCWTTVALISGWCSGTHWGPYAEPSSIPDDTERALRTTSGRGRGGQCHLPHDAGAPRRA